jgi:uncharacterized membrane protein YphA (DoxX/SURF4 family)
MFAVRILVVVIFLGQGIVGIIDPEKTGVYLHKSYSNVHIWAEKSLRVNLPSPTRLYANKEIVSTVVSVIQIAASLLTIAGFRLGTVILMVFEIFVMALVHNPFVGDPTEIMFFFA